MSDSYAGFLRHHVYAIVDKYTAFDKDSVVDYLAGIEAAPSSKAVLAKGIGKFMLWNGLADPTEHRVIIKSFRAPSNDWSTSGMTAEMVGKFVSVAYQKEIPLTAYRDALIMAIAGSIGLRRGQLTALNIEDIELEGSIMRINITKQKYVQRTMKIEKSKKVMQLQKHIGGVLLSRLVVDYLRERHKYSPQDRALFVNQQGGRISGSYIQKMVKKLREYIGYDKVSIHSFRHYVGSAVANNRGILAAANLLDHSNITVTMKYVTKDYETEGL